MRSEDLGAAQKWMLHRALQDSRNVDKAGKKTAVPLLKGVPSPETQGLRYGARSQSVPRSQGSSRMETKLPQIDDARQLLDSRVTPRSAVLFPESDTTRPQTVPGAVVQTQQQQPEAHILEGRTEEWVSEARIPSPPSPT
ncbi:hypothetical protein CYMTET_12650 [Cymbomonas tetramitiformis]|uniref:Uncharacterized protein n=1 Tax=Cymbomonas tetramitiformis TaxID=36881 RepID=A0AAE0LC86_9CHLO|nr:hypothetical protein CYMTET_12650 [Cymbomonas tetramitiformis]